jgi:exopolysaccharide biosynthesis polyprenyl glycosylphosphotransferase
MGFYSDGFDFDAYVAYGLIAAAGVLIEAMARPQDSKNLIEREGHRARQNTLRQTIYVMLCLSLYLVMSKDTRMSRGFLLGYAAIAYLALYISNRWLPGLLAKASFWRRGSDVRTLLVGHSSQRDLFSRWVTNGKQLGMRIIGVVADRRDDDIGKMPWRNLGTLDSVEETLAKRRIDQLIVMGFPERVEEIKRLAAICERNGVRFLLLNDLGERIGRRVTNLNLNGTNLMTIYEEPLEDPLNRVVKRVLDIIISLIALCTILPVMGLAVWIAHRLQSPGPLIYKQERSGWGGKPFMIYKFRSLHVDNDDEGKQVSRDDPRVFPLGHWMRKLCIDELPQFLNVLFGSMSLVGPRPHLKVHDDIFAQAMANYRVRSFVKPGMTGLAQVRGYRGETREDHHIIDRVECDILYLENWSLRMDLEILFKTAFQVLKPPKTAL